MATTKQVKARSSAQKSKPAARNQRAIPRQSSSTRSALPKQRASVSSSKRAGSSHSALRQGSSIASSKRVGSSLKTRAELYEIAKKQDLPGRSRMGRQELASKLGVR